MRTTASILTINGQEFPAQAGKTLPAVARRCSADIPTLSRHKKIPARRIGAVRRSARPPSAAGRSTTS